MSSYALLKPQRTGGTTLVQMLDLVFPPLGIRRCNSSLQNGSEQDRCNVHDVLLGVGNVAVVRWKDAVLGTSSPLRDRQKTMIMMRDPADRLYSAYHSERNSDWCPERAQKLGLAGCAARNTTFLEWATASSDVMQSKRLLRKQLGRMHAETIWLLGRGASPAAKFSVARGIVSTVTVVGVTERFEESVVALSMGWNIDLPSLVRVYGRWNARTRQRPELSDRLRTALMTRSPGLRAEAALYSFALRRLTRSLSNVSTSQLESMMAMFEKTNVHLKNNPEDGALADSAIGERAMRMTTSSPRDDAALRRDRGPKRGRVAS